jgi:NADPH-dependent ferric siderophore reductase
MLDAFCAGRRSLDDCRQANQRHPAIVTASESLSPNVRRLTLAVAGLDLDPPRPAQWVKLHVPDGRGGFQRGRAYTVRAAADDHIVLDIARHAGGVCSDWAEAARPGARVLLTGPRPGLKRGGRYRHLLLGGDETALPAIACMLEHLPAGTAATAYIEVPDAADRQPLALPDNSRLTWLARRDRPAGHALAAALMGVPLDVPECGVWIAAERDAAVALHAHFAARLGEDNVITSGYWRRPVTASFAPGTN